MSFVRLSLSVILLVGTAATAFADTVRVVVDRALVWTQPGGVSIVMSQLLKGQTAEVVRRVGDWYEIVAPPGSGGGDHKTGFISASQVVIDSVGPVKQRAAAAQRGPGAPARSAVHAGILNVDAVYRVGGKDLVRATAAFADIYAEQGSITTNFGGRSGAALGVLVAYPLWGQIGIGGGLDYYLRSPHAQVEAHVPHPFFFNQLRTATFETAGLSSHEASVHIPVLWMPPSSGSLRFLAFGGPTIFHVSQTIVSDVTLEQHYPYDTVTITGVTTAERTKTLLGFHVGGDVTHFLKPTIGVGGGVRYSRATMKFDNDANATTTGVAGALEIAAGLRFKF